MSKGDRAKRIECHLLKVSFYCNTDLDLASKINDSIYEALEQVQVDKPHLKLRGSSNVTENNYSVFLIIMLMIVAFAGTFYVRNYLTKKAILKVVKIFYQHNALGINGAKTLRELGLERPDFVHRMMKPRDYKQMALQILIKRGIINVREGRLYLVEERLDQDLRAKSNDLMSHGRS